MYIGKHFFDQVKKENLHELFFVWVEYKLKHEYYFWCTCGVYVMYVMCDKFVHFFFAKNVCM